MPLEPELLGIMSDRFTLTQRTGAVNFFGEPVFSSPVADIPAHIDWTLNMVQNAEGEDVSSSAVVYMNTTPVVEVGDLVEVDGDYTERVVVSVVRYSDEVNHHHQQVYLS